MCVGGGEYERDKQTNRQTETATEYVTDRQTDRQTDRDTKRERQRGGERNRPFATGGFLSRAFQNEYICQPVNR